MAKAPRSWPSGTEKRQMRRSHKFTTNSCVLSSDSSRSPRLVLPTHGAASASKLSARSCQSGPAARSAHCVTAPVRTSMR